MFKPHYGTCASPSCRRAGQTVIIPVKSGLCDECNYNEKQAKKSGRGTVKTLPEKIKNKIENYERINDSKTKSSFSAGKKKKKISRKPKTATGEAALFLEIWEEKQRATGFFDSTTIQCSICREPLHSDKPLAGYFSHILPKSTYGGFRLRKDNIEIMCLKCHHEWDFGNRNHPKFEKLREKAQNLKEEYNGANN